VGWYYQLQGLIRQTLLQTDMATSLAHNDPPVTAESPESQHRNSGSEPCSYGQFNHFRIRRKLLIVVNWLEVQPYGFLNILQSLISCVTLTDTTGQGGHEGRVSAFSTRFENNSELHIAILLQLRLYTRTRHLSNLTDMRFTCAASTAPVCGSGLTAEHCLKTI
jgi:hypothetical protein